MPLQLIIVLHDLTATQIPIEVGWLLITCKYVKVYSAKGAPSALTPKPLFRLPFTHIPGVKGDEG